jgi:hypothetical protein
MKGLYRLHVTVVGLILFAAAVLVLNDAVGSRDSRSFVSFILSGVLFAIGLVVTYAVWTPTEYERGKGFAFRFRRIPVYRDDENKYLEFLAMKKHVAPKVEDTNSVSTQNRIAVSSPSELDACSDYQLSEEGSSYAAPV